MVLLPKKLFHLLLEGWQIGLGRVPNDGKINFEVGMNEPVSHSHHLPPGKFWVGISEAG